jgi:hypothetical protein
VPQSIETSLRGQGRISCIVIASRKRCPRL